MPVYPGALRVARHSPRVAQYLRYRQLVAKSLLWKESRFLSQLAFERRFMYVTGKGGHYRGNCAGTESLHDSPGKFIGALGRS